MSKDRFVIAEKSSNVPDILVNLFQNHEDLDWCWDLDNKEGGVFCVSRSWGTQNMPGDMDEGILFSFRLNAVCIQIMLDVKGIIFYRCDKITDAWTTLAYAN